MTPLSDERIDELERVARKATQGEWWPGHLSNDECSCNCPYVLSEGYCGSICTIDVSNDLPISEGGNDSPPLEEAKANQRHIAAFDPPTVLSLLSELKALREGNSSSSVSVRAAPSGANETQRPAGKGEL